MALLTTFFKLIRWKNISLMIYVQLLIKFVLFPSFQVPQTLTVLQFALLLSSIVFIAAAGYIINDIYDVKIDTINKPNSVIISRLVSKETAYKWYLVTNVLGVVSGVILAFNLGDPSLAFLFFIPSLLLYYYSKKLKGMAFVGNVLISLLIAYNVLILTYFEKVVNAQIITFILLLSSFAFVINFMRELIKDIEDIKGDYSFGLETLPITLGVYKAKQIASLLGVLFSVVVLYFLFGYWSNYKITLAYLVLFVLFPMGFTIFKLMKATTKSDFSKLSVLLKIMMFFGVNTIIIFSIYN
ncbi:geranylgeranylglycerol-phosphate geranylgeranyltransferase [Lutibacter sp.]